MPGIIRKYLAIILHEFIYRSNVRTYVIMLVAISHLLSPLAWRRYKTENK
jgi:hypothetical protein